MKSDDDTLLTDISPPPPKKIYATNKINVYQIDDNLSMNLLNLNNFGSKNIKGFRYILSINDILSKIGCTVASKVNSSQFKRII